MNLEQRSSMAALLLRCSTGVLFLAHGAYLKLVVFGMAGTVGFFQSLGYSAALAYAVVIAETLGGLALIAGVYSRWVALALVPVLVGAVQVHAGNGWLFSAANGGWEYPVFWIVVMLAVAVLGDGRYSLSHYLSGNRQSARAVPAAS